MQKNKHHLDTTWGWILMIVPAIILVFLLSGPYSPELIILIASVTLIAVTAAGSVWLLFFTGRLHRVTQQQTGGTYPVTPLAAVGYSCIPLFNVYWHFKWLLTMIGYIQNNAEDKSFSKAIPFIIIVFGFIPVQDPVLRYSLASLLGNIFSLLLFTAIRNRLFTVSNVENPEETSDSALLPESAKSRGSAEQTPVLIFSIILSVLFFITVITGAVGHFAFLSGRNLLNILRQGLPLMLLSLGFHQALRRDEIDFSLPAQCAVYGFVFVLILNSPLYSSVNSFWIAAVFICLILGIVIGTIQGTLTAYTPAPSFLVTAAVSVLLGLVMRYLHSGSPILLEARGSGGDLGLFYFCVLIALSVLFILHTESQKNQRHQFLRNISPYLLGGMASVFYAVHLAFRIRTVTFVAQEDILYPLTLAALSSGLFFRNKIPGILIAAATTMIWTLSKNIFLLSHIGIDIQQIIFSAAMVSFFIINWLLYSFSDRPGKNGLPLFFRLTGTISVYSLLSSFFLYLFFNYTEVAWVRNYLPVFRSWWVLPLVLTVVGFLGYGRTGQHRDAD